MRKPKNTYYPVLSKHLIMLGFLMLLIAKPIINTVFVFDNNNYEWYNSFDKETSEEKEISTDFENENIEFNHFTQVLFYSKISKSNLYFKQENMFQNNSLDIFLPPPELL